MSTVITPIADYQFLGGASEVVGYHSGTVRAVRYKVRTPNIGASEFSFTKTENGLREGSAVDVRFLVSANPDEYEAICSELSKGNPVNKTYAGGYYTFAGAVGSLCLLPNTDYYLYIFPATTDYGTYSWNGPASTITVTLDGAAGTAHIQIGSQIVIAMPYLDNGTGWDLTIPYSDNGTVFRLCGCSGETHDIAGNHQAFSDANGSPFYAAGQQFLVKKE